MLLCVRFRTVWGRMLMKALTRRLTVWMVAQPGNDALMSEGNSMKIFAVDYAVLVLVLLYNAWSLLAKRLGSKKHWKV
jgi:hypothetical protein